MKQAKRFWIAVAFLAAVDLCVQQKSCKNPASNSPLWNDRANEGKNAVPAALQPIASASCLCSSSSKVCKETRVSVFSHHSWQHVDKWSFAVFALNGASGDHGLKWVFCELLTVYDVINRFKVSCEKSGLFFHLGFCWTSLSSCFVPFRVQF